MSQLQFETDYFNEVLDYHRDTGICIWKKRPRTDFDSSAKTKAWNNKHSGTEAGNIDHRFHIMISMFGKTFTLAKVVWLMNTGTMPRQMFFRNGSRGDLRWENLTIEKVPQPTPPGIELLRLSKSSKELEQPYYTIWSKEARCILIRHYDEDRAKTHIKELADKLVCGWKFEDSVR